MRFEDDANTFTLGTVAAGGWVGSLGAAELWETVANRRCTLLVLPEKASGCGGGKTFGSSTENDEQMEIW